MRLTARIPLILLLALPATLAAQDPPSTQEPPAEQQPRQEPVVEAAETIIVTATRTDTRLQDQPVRVEVIDREEIEE